MMNDLCNYQKLSKYFFLLGKWGYHRQGSCQAGLGAAIDKVRLGKMNVLICNELGFKFWKWLSRF